MSAIKGSLQTNSRAWWDYEGNDYSDSITFTSRKAIVIHTNMRQILQNILRDIEIDMSAFNAKDIIENFNPIYRDIFTCRADVQDHFAPSKWDKVDDEDWSLADSVKILYAYYSYEDYSGTAEVIYLEDGKLYSVTGGHCSCNGLEGQWEPCEINPLQLLAEYATSPDKRRIFQYVMAVQREAEYTASVENNASTTQPQL